MRKLSHNKKRNLGLVYELLTREVADSVVAKDSKRAAAACGVLSGHLSEGCALFPELSLHRQVIGTRGASERLARRVVDELKAAGIRGAVRRPLIERAKTDLIHEMNHRFGRDIFDRYRIPDYTAHASVGILLARGLNGQLDEGVELAKIEDHLIGYMMSEASTPVGYDRDATLYAYRTAVGLFEKEFGRELTGAQSELLREYVRVSLGGNPAPFQRTFERQRTTLREVLKARRADEVFKADADMSKRLDEAISELSGLPAAPTDESVERMMLFHNLHASIDSE